MLVLSDCVTIWCIFQLSGINFSTFIIVTYLQIAVKVVHLELYFNINIFNMDLSLFYFLCFSLIKYFEVCLILCRKPLKSINLYQ